jgi:anti-sigma B factor antagonist
MDMQIEEHLDDVDDSALVVLEDRLNAVSAPEVKEQLKRLPQRGQIHVVVDMSSVSFIDSSGLAALVSGLKAAREAGGTFKLAGANEQARQVFEITKLDQVFELHPDRESAIEALRLD